MAYTQLLSLNSHTHATNTNNKMSYVLVTGGTLSGIGKGVIASSTGLILRALGFNVTSIKIDPYLNIDAGTMSPFEHGEVFVLNDGGEADLDLGNYERFIGISLARDNNITTGKIYNEVIEKERRGDYLGKTVQVVPHIVDAIQNWIERVAQIPTGDSKESPNICVIELGGTIGDIESSPFIEALRQFQFRVGIQNFVNIHVALVPVMGSVGEQKTKPIQQSVRILRANGIFPDIIVCRSSTPLQADPRQKISQFCQVYEESVLSCPDVSNLYRVPLLLVEQKLDYLILHRLSKLPMSTPSWTEWKKLAEMADSLQKKEGPRVHIAIVGKYTGLQDSYLSVIKALEHAAISEQVPIKIDWIESTDLEISLRLKSENSTSLPKYRSTDIPTPEEIARSARAVQILKDAHGVLVPGGFGDRGIEGMISAITHARVSKVPYFGICLGMQVAVIEYCRSVLGMGKANSEEFERDCEEKVVVFMPEISKSHMGGTMRLGRRTTYFIEKHRKISKLIQCYRESAPTAADFGIHVTLSPQGDVLSVDERHRHRYEVNPDVVPQLEEAGMYFVGMDENKERMEVVEIEDHPYFVGVQYHPEFQSRPQWPSPPFFGFVRAADAYFKSKVQL